ncbi:cyclic nucleotide-binding domain-containing protein [Desulfofundulus thermobenzoicus]|uniref:Cyclic nucleotide-binding domain-containing protein n=1 Tax=Desulfofundulus thermobenzoicus TaxID=29376 RepID=A0A6N7INQ4_9FIRM|nr:Crp/Fnr family transcriptional regulator [Desulfofundulus thermobenzoicus]MQL51253.1 cyclic nucleotide-binding domain-containing protein [Desulfofundulus thermobenzoicus]HHW44893.1 Crp/Fnr family transcriptional regulator [Desulfotomaculum sp.]
MPGETEQLRHIYLFAGLSDSQLQEIARVMLDRKYRKGHIIFMEGEPGEAVYLLKTGRVKIFKQDEEGREQILHYINPGEVFAEVVLFDGGDYPACAEVVEDAQVGMIRNRDMDDLLLKNPSIALALLKIMARRLRVSQRQIMELALKDTTRRLASVLLELAREHGSPAEGGLRIEMNLTNQELASMIGTSRETANRILSEFRRDKAIAVTRQGIVIFKDRLKTWL